jgi:methylmalonic aciduria homocystinuria type C protein
MQLVAGNRTHALLGDRSGKAVFAPAPAIEQSECRMSTRALFDAPCRALQRLGFDLLQRFDTASYNASEHARVTGFRLPDFGRARALGLLVANGSSLWRPFVAAVETNARLQQSLHPLNDYTEAAVAELRRVVGLPSIAFYAHGQPPFVPIQRIAEASGLAELSPSHLSVHADVGPWLGLRAVVVFDAEPPASAPLLRSLCHACSRPCLKALDTAIAADHMGRHDSWRAWLAVRDSCPVGRSHRYAEAQIRYHYTKDTRALRE